MKLCIVTKQKLEPTETFIKLVVESLPYETTHLYWDNGTPVINSPVYGIRPLSIAQRNTRILNILPTFVEFRIRRKWFRQLTENELLSHFFSHNTFDAVFAQYGPTGVAILPAAKSAGIPLITQFHGYDASNHEIIRRHKDDYKSLFEYCTSVVAVSERMRNDLIALGCSESKLSVIYYGFHPDFTRAEPDRSSNNIIMVGRLTDQKAPHLSLLAFARAHKEHPCLTLTVIGDGELRSVCRDLTKALSIEKAVRFIGTASRKDIIRHISQSFLFLQHSIEGATGDREGTPVAIIEAAAAGLPIISTVHAGIPDVIDHGVNGLLVPEGDVHQMAMAICRLHMDRAYAENLGTTARAKILAHFQISHQVKALSQLFSNNCFHQKQTKATDQT